MPPPGAASAGVGAGADGGVGSTATQYRGARRKLNLAGDDAKRAKMG
jgi:hypothetical protein